MGFAMLRIKRALLSVCAVGLLVTGLVVATPGEQQILNVTGFATEIRADLETAADDLFGTGQRPENWTGNIDNTTPTYVPDLWFDKELLASSEDVYGETTRPPEWFGITVDVADIIARNVRHDLELVADEIYGFDVRPPNWNGAEPIYRCGRTLQNVYFLSVNNYSFNSEVPEDEFGYCTLVEAELRDFLLNQRELEPSGEALDQAILATRGDIERLANEVFGVNDRPLNWTGNANIESPLLLTDNYADLGLLADEVLGDNNRPEGYIGLITESRVETWRNLRHDIEILANEIVPLFPSIEGERPRGWQGTDPLRACPLLTQDLVLVLEDNFTDEGASFSRFDFEGAENYCETVLQAANNFAEDPPLSEIDRLLAEGDGLLYEAEFAFAYLDSSALTFMGVMPLGTQFRAWYRNFNDSTMMFVSGRDFAVYIDRRWTDMPQDVFDRLPTLEGVAPLAFCDADWCNGPGPTPTPTGGAIESLLAFETPVIEPTVDPVSQIPSEEKTEVDFITAMVINYLQDNEDERTAQVTLRLCPDPSLVAVSPEECEPVISVFNTATGEQEPVLRQQNGLNVYEFPYGFQENFQIESATLRTTGIFLISPDLPRN